MKSTPGAVTRYAQLASTGTNQAVQTRKFPTQETITMILRGRLARLSGIVPAAVAIAGIGVAFQLRPVAASFLRSEAQAEGSGQLLRQPLTIHTFAEIGRASCRERV